MSESDIEDAQLQVMIRTMDSWFLLNPEIAYNAVTAWLESVKVYQAKEVDVLDAEEISE